MDYIIREMKSSEYYLLADFLYEAIFIPKGVEPPPKTIIKLPELQVYIADFGELKDDHCFIAEADNKPVGAVWVRIMNDYGHVDSQTPSFAISLYKEYRGYGIGTEMMKTMLRYLTSKGYSKASLAVQKNNYAVKMYEKVGFKISCQKEEEYIMICRLK